MATPEPDPRETRFSEIAVYMIKIVGGIVVLALAAAWLLRKFLG